MTNKELVHKWNGHKGIIIYPTNEVEELIDATIKALEQEPKTGRWWERNTYPQECKCWDCSECQETVFERTNYCPNCGAKMESEEKDERSNT